MNICCSGVKIILIDNILRTKLLRQLMTFLTVQLLFDKLRHTLLFCRTYLTRNFLKYTVQCKQRYIRTSKCYRSGFKIIFSISKASIFFFFLMPFPFFAIRLLRYLFRSAVFPFSNSILPILSFLQVVRRGSGALSPATHAHSTFSRRDSNPC
jgi:hypothetical protein